MEFKGFPKIARLNRECVITEKIDGTNGSIYIPESYEVIDSTKPLTDSDISLWGKPFLVGSRNRWITPEDDNFGFAKWAYANADELLKLGPGHHFGEWWGKGIQSGYGLNEKRFSLFNTGRWAWTPVDKQKIPPAWCHVVPVLYQGLFSSKAISAVLFELQLVGSKAAPGFMKPEGIVIYHTASGTMFKITLEGDDKPKSL